MNVHDGSLAVVVVALIALQSSFTYDDEHGLHVNEDDLGPHIYQPLAFGLQKVLDGTT